jgi:hypothetical protein
LNQAIGRPKESLQHWQSALKALSQDNLSPSELKQKEQYEQNLRDAQHKVENQRTPAHFVLKNDQEVPWIRAEKMYPELVAAGPSMYSSSVSHHDTNVFFLIY